MGGGGERERIYQKSQLHSICLRPEIDSLALWFFLFWKNICLFLKKKKGGGEEDKPLLGNGNVSNSFSFKVMRYGTLWIWGSLSQGCNTAGRFFRGVREFICRAGPWSNRGFHSPQSQHLETIALGFLAWAVNLLYRIRL